MRQIKITTQITNRDSQSIEKYLQEIAKLDLVTPEEEVELARKIRLGDESALEKMVRSNLRFVVSVAKQYQHQGLPLSDLINDGNVGLIKAAQRFDETKGFKFISYAVWWIRQAIMQSLLDQSRLVRLPLNKVGNYSKVNRAMLQFEQENEREPTPEEVAEMLDLNVSEISTLMSEGSKKHMSTDAPLADGEDLTFGDLIEDANEATPDKSLLKESLQTEIRSVLKSLPSREAGIVAYFYGLNGQALSLDEIADKFELTRERVRQIKEKAIKKMRRGLYSDNLRTYLG
jgi:RNA polymerase primary sigma factor